MKIPLPLSS